MFQKIWQTAEYKQLNFCLDIFEYHPIKDMEKRAQRVTYTWFHLTPDQLWFFMHAFALKIKKQQ